VLAIEKRYGTWKFVERKVVTDWRRSIYEFFSLLGNETE
jgi:hypothetical protein